MRSINVFFLICIFLSGAHSTESAGGANGRTGKLLHAELPEMDAEAVFARYLWDADSLFAAGDYFLASIAYERAFYVAEDMHARTLANLGKVNANKQRGNYEKARHDIQRSLPYTGDRDLRFQVLYEAAFCAFMTGSYRESMMHLQQIANQYGESSYDSKTRLLFALNLAETGDWDRLAGYVLQQADKAGNPQAEAEVSKLLQLLEPDNRPVMKEPGKARMLSTFLPGAGHLYAAEPGKAFLNTSSQLISLGIAGLLLFNGYYISTATIGLNLFQSFYFGGIRQAGMLTGKRNDRMRNSYKEMLSEGIISLEEALGAGAYEKKADLDKLLESTMLALYDFNFHQADSISAHARKVYPDHYLSHFCRTNYLWWMIISGFSTSDYEDEYKASISMSLAYARNHLQDNQTSSDDLFYLISIYAMHARLDLKNGTYVRALRNGRGVIHHVELSRGRELHYPGFFLTSGLYNYMTAKAGQQYPFLKLYSLFYPEGDKELGLYQLNQAAGSDYVIWQTEAHYFLMRIYLEIENDPGSSLRHAAWLTSRYPSNLIYQYYHLEALKALADHAAVKEKTEEIRREAYGNRHIKPAQRLHFLSLIRQE